MPLALDLANFVTRTQYEDLPPLAIERAKMVIASTFASAAVGTSIQSARIVRSLAKERGGLQSASIWFDGQMVPLADAARANAMLSDAAASDDSDIRNVAHIGTVATAAALASGERMVASGRDVLTALALGYEVAGRIGGVVNPGSKGFHASVITIFAPCVATAKLFGLDAEETAHAIVLASTSIGGQAISTNSWAREYHSGNSALLGVNAALTARRGYTAQLDLLEAPRGYIETFGGKDGAVPALEGLGQRWEIIDHLAVKLHPCSHTFHSLTEAAINAATEGNVRPEDVESVRVARPKTRPQGNDMIARPKDLADTLHSLPYCIAAAVVDRDFTWSHVDMAKVNRPEVQMVADRVSLEPDPQGMPELKWTYGGRVTIKTKSGRTYSSVVDAWKGSGQRGIAWADIEAKYRALMPASGLPAQRIEASFGAIKTLDEAKSVSDLTEMLS